MLSVEYNVLSSLLGMDLVLGVARRKQEVERDDRRTTKVKESVRQADGVRCCALCMRSLFFELLCLGGGADTITFFRKIVFSHPHCVLRHSFLARSSSLLYRHKISSSPCAGSLISWLARNSRRSITPIFILPTTMRRNPVPLVVWLCLSWLWSSHVVVTGIEAQADEQIERDEQEPPLSSSDPPMDQDPVDTQPEENAASSSSSTTTCPAAELSEQALREKCQAMWQSRALELQQAQDQQATLDRQALEQQWQTTLTQSVQAVRDELATECTQTMQQHKTEAHTACQGQLDELQQVHQQALQQQQQEQEQEQSTRHETQIADLQEQLRHAQHSLTTAQDRHSTELEACRTTALQHAQEETAQEWQGRLQAVQDQLDQQAQKHHQQLQQTHNEVQATVEARIQAALDAQQTQHSATTQLVEQAIQQTTLQLEQAHEGHLQTLHRRYTLTHDELQQVQAELQQLERQHTQLINDLLQARQDLLQAHEIVRLYRLGWLQRWIGHPLTRFGQTVYDRLVQPLGYEVYLVGQPVLDPLNDFVVQPYMVPAALVAWETTGQTATVVSEWLQHKVVHPTAQAVRHFYRVHVCQTMPRALEQGVIWAWPKLVQGSQTAWTTSRETLQHAHQVYTTQVYPTAVQPWWDPVLEYWDEYVQEPWTNEWKPLVLQHYARGQSILLHQYWTPFAKSLFDHVQQRYYPDAPRDSHTQYGDDDDNTIGSTSPSSLLYHVTEYWATEPQESLYWIQGGLLVVVSLVTVRLLATCCCGCGCYGLSKRSSSNFAKRNRQQQYGSTTPPPKVRIQEPPTTTTPPLADPATTTTTTPRTTTHRGPQQQPHAPPPRRMTPYPKHPLNKTTNNNNNNLGGPPPPPSSSTTAPPSRPLFAGATAPPPRTTTARGPPPSKKKS